MPALNLSVSCSETDWGQHVAVVGSWNNWDKKRFKLLETSESSYPHWHAELSVPDDSPVEYKYIIVSHGSIARWESNDRVNRVANPPADTHDVYGRITATSNHASHVRHDALQSRPWASGGVSVGANGVVIDGLDGLDALENAVVKMTAERKSWRQRLSFARALFTERDVAADAGFEPRNIDHLATLSVYLTFLSSGQILCEEDGGHHRPNHHANEARQIESALAAITRTVAEDDVEESERVAFIPYVVRSIFPQLPSYSSQFTASVPLTRIRDIAHRGDIPHDLKQEIKHTLQNKLHRCAGPEDLQTSARLLERINNGSFSQDFAEQFRIFHAELCEFFNASSLDDRLQYLSGNENTKPVAILASRLYEMKRAKEQALPQLEVLTDLRAKVAELPLMESVGGAGGDDELPSEDVQKVRLADIDLDGYAFLLLAGIAKDAEEQNVTDFNWSQALLGLSLSLQNVGLSGIRPKELRAAAAELYALCSRDEIPNLLRAKAGVDRALNFSRAFSSTISDVYSRRAASIGRALGVAKHAVEVFAEAEIRSNITFQASRIADACAKTCRQALSLPPWNPLFDGTAKGRLVHVEHLSDISADETGPILVVCRTAEGEEDIPVNVKGVVLGRSLPHLSHLGVRARQARVVFVCAEDNKAFSEVWGFRSSSHVRMVVNGTKGLAAFDPVETGADDAAQTGSDDDSDSAKPLKEVDIKFDSSVTEPTPLSQATFGTTSSKVTFAGRLSILASDSAGLFEAPDGIALPHGMFQAELSAHAKQYESLVKEYVSASSSKTGGTKAAAQTLYTYVQENLKPSEAHCAEIQKAFDADARVMVRSSANAEDLKDMSGAGLYDSLANIPVHNTPALQRAIASIWASLWTLRAASSRTACGVPHNKVSMAVLVQEMVPADLSFIAFSRDPVSGQDGIYIEVAVGMGETLASASFAGSPYRFRVRAGDVETLGFASYGVAFVPAPDGLRRQVVDYSRERMTIMQAFRERLVTRVAEIVGRLGMAFDGPQDVEGAVTVHEGEPRVFVVQARPQIL